ncbi:MAG: DJ-1/PfpI family protein [Firmicutes bacterium]|nr:DJ-1/PfpI family protein [Bacillota bacterium]
MIYLFLADGFEELEAVAPLDILRRAGVEIQTVGVGGKTAVGSHGIAITCDITLDRLDAEGCRGVILPGGPGRTGLAESFGVLEMIRVCAQHGAMLAAICGAPPILGEQGYLRGKKACCYPGYEDKLLGAEVLYDPVVTDDNIITSRGAGTAVAFGLAIAAYLVSPEKAREIAAQMQCP